MSRNALFSSFSLLQIQVPVFWKILAVPDFGPAGPTCEKTFDIDSLAAKGVDTLMCLEIPSTLARQRPPKLSKANVARLIQRRKQAQAAKAAAANGF